MQFTNAVLLHIACARRRLQISILSTHAWSWQDTNEYALIIIDWVNVVVGTMWGSSMRGSGSDYSREEDDRNRQVKPRGVDFSTGKQGSEMYYCRCETGHHPRTGFESAESRSEENGLAFS